MPMVQKNSVRFFESGAPPDITSDKRPPVCARIFEYTSAFASDHCARTANGALSSPHRHLADRLATFIDQSNSFRLISVALLSFFTLRVLIFLYTRGTA